MGWGTALQTGPQDIVGLWEIGLLPSKFMEVLEKNSTELKAGTDLNLLSSDFLKDTEGSVFHSSSKEAYQL